MIYAHNNLKKDQGITIPTSIEELEDCTAVHRTDFQDKDKSEVARS